MVNHDPERAKPQSRSIGEKTEGKFTIISLGRDTPTMTLLSERTRDSSVQITYMIYPFYNYFLYAGGLLR